MFMASLEDTIENGKAVPSQGSVSGDAYPDDAEEFAALIEGTNINSDTFLATDYLNNFNELIMLVDLLPDDSELMEDLRNWRPLHYLDHFSQSGFPHPKLAMAGWRRAEERRREALNDFVTVIGDQIEKSVCKLDKHLAAGDSDGVARECADVAAILAKIHEWASGLIQGSDSLDMGEIDRLMTIETATPR